jgi:hypothetical protein
MTGALYDDPAFFRRYQQLRQQRAGLNEDLEQPALARLLPPLADADVLEIGCGDGTLAQWRQLVQRCAGWLRPGGHLVYSVEHPLCTGRDPMDGWHDCGAESWRWPQSNHEPSQIMNPAKP